MTDFSVNDKKYEPYKSFIFKIKWDGRYVAGISEISALKQTNEVENNCISGDTSSLSKLSRQLNFGSITLKRGVTYDSDFEQWVSKSRSYGSNLGDEVSFQDIRKNLVIEMYNEAGQLVTAYKVFRSWVSEFQSMPKLDASANEVAIESMKLENEGWERVV